MFIRSKVIKRQSQGKYTCPGCAWHLDAIRAGFCGWMMARGGGNGRSGRGGGAFEFVNRRPLLPLTFFYFMLNSFLFSFCASLINASVNKAEVITFFYLALPSSLSLSLSLFTLFIFGSGPCIFSC